MPDPAENVIQVEPLTKEEREKQGMNTSRMEADPDFPIDWKPKAKKMADAIDQGFRYYRRNIGNKIYMLLRKGRKDISLGQCTEEREGKLFHFFPYLTTQAGIPKPPPWVSQGATAQGRQFLSVPINRIGIIPRDYVPTIEVIRYFQILKKNGFPGDFSKFINDIVEHHMADCHGISLPVMLEEEGEVCQQK